MNKRYKSAFALFDLDEKCGVQAHILHKGTWDDFHFPVFDTVITRDSDVIEVGSHIGFHTLYMAKKCRNIYAFEPQINYFNQLKNNIALNGLSNIKAFNFAVANATELRTPQDLDIKHGPSRAMIKANSGVKTIILDNFFNDKFFIKNPLNLKYIKIDAQGADVQILKGARKLLEKYRPVISFETETELAGRYYQCDSNFEFLNKDFGYQIFHHYASNELGNNYLAIPEGSTLLENESIAKYYNQMVTWK